MTSSFRIGGSLAALQSLPLPSHFSHSHQNKTLTTSPEQCSTPTNPALSPIVLQISSQVVQQIWIFAIGPQSTLPALLLALSNLAPSYRNTSSFSFMPCTYLQPYPAPARNTAPLYSPIKTQLRYHFFWKTFPDSPQAVLMAAASRPPEPCLHKMPAKLAPYQRSYFL